MFLSIELKTVAVFALYVTNPKFIIINNKKIQINYCNFKNIMVY